MNRRIIAYLYCLHLLTASNVYAYPITFNRLILKKDNKIIKVVDLIGDFHAGIEHKVRKASRTTPTTLLTHTEKEKFTSVERTLIRTIRELGNQRGREATTLLWEWNDEMYQMPQFTTKAFMFDKGSELRKQFAKDQHKNIVFISADTYRSHGPFIEFGARALSGHPFNETLTVADVLAFVKDPLKNNPKSKHLAQIDLDNISDATIKKALTTDWETFVANTIEPFVQKYEQYQNTSIKDFVTAHTDVAIEFFQDLLSGAYKVMTDYELLFKLFGKYSTKHVIIYAGELHCEAVIKKLQNNFNFVSVIRCGIGGNIEQEIILESLHKITLVPHVWHFLKEPIYKRVAHPYDHILSVQDILDFFEATAHNKQDEAKAELQKAHKAYIDLVNAQDASFNTALCLAALNNELPMVKFLLDHGAYVNLANEVGETPLYFAVTQNYSELAKILLMHGANPLQKNIDGKSPLDKAKEKTIKKQDSSFEKLLTRYAKRWQHKQ